MSIATVIIDGAGLCPRRDCKRNRILSTTRGGSNKNDKDVVRPTTWRPATTRRFDNYEDFHFWKKLQPGFFEPMQVGDEFVGPPMLRHSELKIFSSSDTPYGPPAMLLVSC